MTEALASVKYIVFFAALFIGVPAAYYLSQRYAIIEKFVFFGMIFFTARMEDINFLSHEHLRLSSRGFEIGMVDLFTLVILMLIIAKKARYKPHFPQGTWLYILYFLFSFLSIINSAFPLYSYFELWKMTRMFIFFYVIYNYIDSFEKLNFIMLSFALIVCYIFLEVLYQKYVLGYFQTYGPFPHQNSLVMYCIILGSLFFSYLLNHKDFSYSKLLFWLLIYSMTTISVISTLSRAGLVLYGLGTLGVLGLSFASGLTQNKMVISFLLLVAFIFMLIKAWDSISERFSTAPSESAAVRRELAIAAVNMTKDKALGIGLNNFGVKINPPYPYGSHIPMHNPDDEEEQNGLVESIYLMIMSESGIHTLIVFLAFIFYYFFLNIRNFVVYEGNRYRYYCIGLAGGLLAIYLESTLEWVLKQTNNFYQLMLVFAIIAAMTKLELHYRKLNSKQAKMNLRNRTINLSEATNA